MRTAYWAAGILCLSLMLWALNGCQTESPGATYNRVDGWYTVNVSSAPDKVTTAAAKAAEDLKLTDVSSTGTKVDGKLVAKTAQGEMVTINIEQAGEDVSKVTIRVGAGDEAVSKQLVDRIKSHLSWL